MYGLSVMASARIGRLSKVVWKSAIRFCVKSRIRFSPRIGSSRLEGGNTELTKLKVDEAYIYAPNKHEWGSRTYSRCRKSEAGKNIGQTTAHLGHVYSRRRQSLRYHLQRSEWRRIVFKGTYGQQQGHSSSSLPAAEVVLLQQVQSEELWAFGTCSDGGSETLSWASKAPHFLMSHGFALKECWRSV